MNKATENPHPGRKNHLTALFDHFSLNAVTAVLATLLFPALSSAAADSGKNNFAENFNCWTVYCDQHLTPRDALTLTADEPVPAINGKKLSGKLLDIPADGADLNKLLNIKPVNFNRALLVKVVECKANETIKLGVGADWWFEAYCNGRITGGTLLAGGNVAYPPTAHDNVVALDLKKGRNVISVLVQSGSIGLFTTAVGKMPADTPAARISRRNEQEAHLPSQAELRHGPWLMAPAPGCMTIGLLTDGYVAGAGVEYRLAGSTQWLRKWDTLGGVLRNDSDLHRITLLNLKPGAKYEYRILLASGNNKFQTLDTHSFTVAPDDNRPFSFFAVGDTQFSIAKRGCLLKNLQKLAEQADFQVSLGDMAAIFDDFDMMFFGGYLNWQGKELYHNKPFVAIRGNHETRGVERSRWFSLLSAEKERGYYTFSYGKTFFIVLDTGGDDTDMKLNSMTADAMREYMQAQKKWLAETVESDEYKNADFRIVLAHEAPHTHRRSRMNDNIRFMAEPLLKAAINPATQIHLWLAGHIHRYRRSVPGSTAVYANNTVDPGDITDGKKYPFTIVTVEGPGKSSPLEISATVVKVNGQLIEVKSYDDKHNCFDSFEITKAGKVIEKGNKLQLQHRDK